MAAFASEKSSRAPSIGRITGGRETLPDGTQRPDETIEFPGSIGSNDKPVPPDPAGDKTVPPDPAGDKTVPPDPAGDKPVPPDPAGDKPVPEDLAAGVLIPDPAGVLKTALFAKRLKNKFG